MTKFDVPEYIEEDGGYFMRWVPTPRETIARQVAEAIVNDREGKIREALIALGWTPPRDAAEHPL